MAKVMAEVLIECDLTNKPIKGEYKVQERVFEVYTTKKR